MTYTTFTRVFMTACGLQSITYGLTFLLPELFAQIGGTTADVGSVLGVTALTTLAVVLLLGEATKRIGIMPPLAASGLICALSLILFARAASIDAMVYFAGGMLGLGWGLFYVLGPIALAQVLKPDQRVTQFTWLSTFVMAGIGVGPIIGYLVGAELGFSVVAVACLACAAAFATLTHHHTNLRVTQADVENDLSFRSATQVMTSCAWRPIVMVGLGASVFAAVSNFQTVYADANGLSYAAFFLAYTVTVIIGRLVMARFIGTHAPYGVIAFLMVVMTAAVLVLLIQSSNMIVYVAASILFGIGYGVAYPIVKAMAANDACPELTAATLQMFGLSYFVGVFGFPFVAGVVITTAGIPTLLIIAALLSCAEGSLAYVRWRQDRIVVAMMSSD
ncbi:MFS transporter [Ruegeria meonggei]|uniref:MFS transporter n=1 Tax=Ruegeria meonggei TaxID=1446476 RepID=UPI0036703044